MNKQQITSMNYTIGVLAQLVYPHDQVASQTITDGVILSLQYLKLGKMELAEDVALISAGICISELQRLGISDNKFDDWARTSVTGSLIRKCVMDTECVAAEEPFTGLEILLMVYNQSPDLMRHAS